MKALRPPIHSSIRLPRQHARSQLSATPSFARHASTLSQPTPCPQNRCKLSKPRPLHRTFLSSFFPNSPFVAPHPTNFSITRTLPYAPAAVYPIIADISAYSAFLPFCTSSVVTAWSTPHPRTGVAYPEEATLTVGWREIRESFISRVHCVPDEAVEALGGDAETKLDKADVKHHTERKGSRKGEVFERMRTAWSLKEAGPEKAEVRLEIEYIFANPLYQGLSGAMQDRVAEYMIEAFEKRVREVLSTPKIG